MPGIEFNQGIPEDIDEPDYMDVAQLNRFGRSYGSIWQRQAYC